MNGDACVAITLVDPIHSGHIFIMKRVRQDLIDQGYKNPIILLHPNNGLTREEGIPLKFRML
jgi:3'-phosphoadenosine 5'-phosphosulfate synthase